MKFIEHINQYFLVYVVVFAVLLLTWMWIDAIRDYRKTHKNDDLINAGLLTGVLIVIAGLIAYKVYLNYLHLGTWYDWR